MDNRVTLPVEHTRTFSVMDPTRANRANCEAHTLLHGDLKNRRASQYGMPRNTAWLYVTISLMVFAEHYKSWMRHIITIIIIFVTSMQGIYSYVPETRRFHKCCSRFVFTVCATLNVISHVKCVLYFYIGTFRSMCVCALVNMAVFCSSLCTCFPGNLLRYCLKDFEMVPVALVTTGTLLLLLLLLLLLFGLCAIKLKR